MSHPIEMPTSIIFEVLTKKSELIFFCYSLDSNKFLFISEALSNILSIPNETILENPDVIFKAIHPDEISYLLKSLDELKTEKTKQDLQFRFVLPDQIIKWISLSVSLTKYEGAEVVIGTAQDITIQKEYSDTLHKYSHKKNSVLTMVSHDLLGPLGTVQLIIGMLKEMSDLADNVQVNRMLHLANQSSQRSIDIIRDLIDQEFLESSEVHLNRQRIDFLVPLKTLVNQYMQQETLVLKKFILQCNSETLFLSVDESKFIQAINNLIYNAIKFTPENGNITIDVEEFYDHVLFKVIDNGIGIPENLQPFLFEKFTKARRIGLLGESSIGLGMSIIKTIVEWHDGKIWFESVENEGTTFFIKLPK